MLSAHQPCYLPWLGFFDKVRRSDTFVLLDDVQFSTGRDNYVNRVRVKSPAGVKWLTLPLDMAGHLDKSIAEMTVLPGWREQHLRTLREYYRGAPHLDILDMLLPPEAECLSDVTAMSCIDLVTDLLTDGLQRLTMQSELGVAGNKTELIVNLCLATGERSFLFGGHGKDYADLALLRDHGIEPVFQEYDHPVYQQQRAPFVEGLSVVDAILNIGMDETRKLLCR